MWLWESRTAKKPSMVIVEMSFRIRTTPVTHGTYTIGYADDSPELEGANSYFRLRECCRSDSSSTIGDIAAIVEKVFPSIVKDLRRQFPRAVIDTLSVGGQDITLAK